MGDLDACAVQSFLRTPAVALDLDVEDFRRLLRQPKPPAIGLVAQFILLPAIALAALSMLLLAIWHLKCKDYWLVLSGVK